MEKQKHTSCKVWVVVIVIVTGGKQSHILLCRLHTRILLRKKKTRGDLYKTRELFSTNESQPNKTGVLAFDTIVIQEKECSQFSPPHIYNRSQM